MGSCSMGSLSNFRIAPGKKTDFYRWRTVSWDGKQRLFKWSYKLNGLCHQWENHAESYLAVHSTHGIMCGRTFLEYGTRNAAERSWGWALAPGAEGKIQVCLVYSGSDHQITFRKKGSKCIPQVQWSDISKHDKKLRYESYNRPTGLVS